MDSAEIRHHISGADALLLYFSSDACGPCAALRPKVQALMDNRFPEMKLLMVSGDSNVQAAADFQVFAFPTLVVFFLGKESKRFSRFVSLAELEQAIARPYGMLFEQA